MCFADRFFFLGGGAHAFLEPQVRLLRITKRDVDLKTSIKMATDTSVTDPGGGGGLPNTFETQHGEDILT